MKDIHSIGQAFKIVSGRTAKGKCSICNVGLDAHPDNKPCNPSQEFPPQNKLTKRVIAFPFDYDLPIKATEEFISIIENIREQAREEMLKEIRTKMTKKLKHYVPDFLTKSDFMMINQGLLKEIK